MQWDWGGGQKVSQWEMLMAETWGWAVGWGRSEQAQGKYWRCSQQALLLMNWMWNKKEKEKTRVTSGCLA